MNSVAKLAVWNLGVLMLLPLVAYMAIAPFVLPSVWLLPGLIFTVIAIVFLVVVFGKTEPSHPVCCVTHLMLSTNGLPDKGECVALRAICKAEEDKYFAQGLASAKFSLQKVLEAMERGEVVELVEPQMVVHDQQFFQTADGDIVLYFANPLHDPAKCGEKIAVKS